MNYYSLNDLVTDFADIKDRYVEKVVAARKHEFNRIMNFLQEYSVATISACRHYKREAYAEYRKDNNLSSKDEVTGYTIDSSNDAPLYYHYKINQKENVLRGKELQQRLYKAGLEGITPVFGVYNGESETSFICFHKDYLYLVDTIIKLGTLFEQDSVCVLRPSAKFGALIKTSPPDINAEPSKKIGQAIMRFSGLKIHNKDDIVDCCSQLNKTRFSFNEKKMRAYRIITGMADANYGMLPSVSEATILHYKCSASGRRVTAPDSIITTSGTAFRDWFNLNKPHPERNQMDEIIIKAMLSFV